jgi:hypothetical protein
MIFAEQKVLMDELLLLLKTMLEEEEKVSEEKEKNVTAILLERKLLKETVLVSLEKVLEKEEALAALSGEDSGLATGKLCEMRRVSKKVNPTLSHAVLLLSNRSYLQKLVVSSEQLVMSTQLLIPSPSSLELRCFASSTGC